MRTRATPTNYGIVIPAMPFFVLLSTFLQLLEMFFIFLSGCFVKYVNYVVVEIAYATLAADFVILSKSNSALYSLTAYKLIVYKVNK